jgi:hypothetical protein
VGVRGRLVASGFTASVTGFLDANHAQLEGVLAVSGVGDLVVSGEMFFGTGLSAFRAPDPANPTGPRVVPQAGDWYVEGRFASAQDLAAGAVSARWSFTGGRVRGTTWVEGSGNVSILGLPIDVRGRFTRTASGTVSYTVRGTSALDTDTRTLILNNPTDANPADDALHGVVRAAVFVVPGARPSDARGLEPVVGRLRGQASYRIEITITRTSFTAAADADASLFYVEAFRRGSATSFSQESTTAFNTIVDIEADLDTETGDLCFRWGDVEIGEC